jgi:hypothetical protein
MSATGVTTTKRLSKLPVPKKISSPLRWNAPETQVMTEPAAGDTEVDTARSVHPARRQEAKSTWSRSATAVFTSGSQNVDFSRRSD